MRKRDELILLSKFLPMPIYMDSHFIPGVQAKHAAEAHRKDLKVQDQFCCRNMTYWVDEHKGMVFCLIDAPSEEAVRDMHDHAHGSVPHEIIAVNSKVVEAFLGRIGDPESYLDPADPNLKIFNDPAFRIILAINTKDTRLLQHDVGLARAKQLLALYQEQVLQQVTKFEGRLIEGMRCSFVASFASVSMGVECAISIQKSMHMAYAVLELRMGLHAGLPVDQSDSLFGKTVQLARYLCEISEENRIVMSAIVSELNKPHFLNQTQFQSRIKRLTIEEEEALGPLVDTLERNWQNPQFGINDFCEILGISKSKLYRKCTSLTGNSPNALLREFRLTNALRLLGNEHRNVSQTAFESGFNSPSYFIKCFQRRFGLLPLSYTKLTP